MLITMCTTSTSKGLGLYLKVLTGKNFGRLVNCVWNPTVTLQHKGLVSHVVYDDKLEKDPHKKTHNYGKCSYLNVNPSKFDEI